MPSLMKLFVHFAYALAASGALFVSSILIAPHVLSMVPKSMTPSIVAVIAILGLVGGFVAGAPFGLCFGLMQLARPIVRSFWTAIGAVTILMLYEWTHGYNLENIRGNFVLIWVNLIEALVFVSVFIFAASVTDIVSRRLNERVRATGAVVILFLNLVLFRDIFLVYLPGFFYFYFGSFRDFGG